jgi:hypothetical protein
MPTIDMISPGLTCPLASREALFATPKMLGGIAVLSFIAAMTVPTKNANHAARTPERDAIQCHRGSSESALAGN